MAAILDLSDHKCNLCKNSHRIGFLIPENIGNDIVFVFFSQLCAKILAALDFQVLMAAILDFVDLMHVTRERKNGNIRKSHLGYILKLVMKKNQLLHDFCTKLQMGLY